jgi:hypothetical protein
VNFFHAWAPIRRNAIADPGLVPIPALANFARRTRAETAVKKGSRRALAGVPVADSEKTGYRCHEFRTAGSFFWHETAN